MAGFQTNLAWDALLELRGRPGPLHARLAGALREAIRDRRLLAGSALPPSRTLAEDLTLLAYSPLLKGVYARPGAAPKPGYDHPTNRARLAVLREVAAELGATPTQVVLAWLMGGQPPMIPVVGASSVAQLEEQLGAVDLRLDDEVRERLDAAGRHTDDW